MTTSEMKSILQTTKDKTLAIHKWVATYSCATRVWIMGGLAPSPTRERLCEGRGNWRRKKKGEREIVYRNCVKGERGCGTRSGRGTQAPSLNYKKLSTPLCQQLTSYLSVSDDDFFVYAFHHDVVLVSARIVSGRRPPCSGPMLKCNHQNVWVRFITGGFTS